MTDKIISCPHCNGKIELKERIRKPIGTIETRTDYKGNTARWRLVSDNKDGTELWTEA